MQVGLRGRHHLDNVAVAERVQREGLTVDDWLACVQKTHPTERLADTGPCGSRITHTEHIFYCILTQRCHELLGVNYHLPRSEQTQRRA